MDDSEQPPYRPFASFGPVMRMVLLMSLYFSCMLFWSMLTKSPKLTWLSPEQNDGYPLGYARLADVIFSVFIFAIPVLVYVNVFPAERFGWLRLNQKVSPFSLLYGALAMIVIMPGLNQLATWLQQSITDPQLKAFEEAMNAQSAWVMQMPGFGDLALCLITSALVPAICEELFFRAGIQQILTEKSRNPHIPIFIIAGIFAAVHSNPSEMPSIFIAGLMLGYGFYWTGSLRMNIIMHFLFNAVSIIEIYAGQHNAAFAAWEPATGIVIASFVLGGAFIFLAWRQARRLLY